MAKARSRAQICCLKLCRDGGCFVIVSVLGDERECLVISWAGENSGGRGISGHATVVGTSRTLEGENMGKGGRSWACTTWVGLAGFRRGGQGRDVAVELR